MKNNIDYTDEQEEKGAEILRLTKDFLLSTGHLETEISGVLEFDSGTKVKQTVTIEIEEV